MSLWDDAANFLEGSWESVTTGATELVDGLTSAYVDGKLNKDEPASTTQPTQTQQDTITTTSNNARPVTGLPFNMTMQELALGGGVLTLVTLLMLRK